MPQKSEFVKFVNDSLFVTCIGNETRWVSPRGDNLIDTRGRVHVEYRDEITLLLMFEKIHYEDRGEWNCVSDVDNVQKFFVMKVYGKGR